MSHHLFIGIGPPAQVREALEGARWQEDEQLHLTMRFDGEVERGVANDLASAFGASRCRSSSWS
jgi:2'-5' RNA ligase